MGVESANALGECFDNPTERQLDSLKGFTYLESFNELRSWTVDDVDPLARSNTSILDRQTLPGTSHHEPPKVMLIHDYKGGYSSYETCQGAATDQDMYSCEYLQSVETFVYFSHKLVTIPPPTWINTCHRNGVKCLGTFIVEPGTTELECILEDGGIGSFWVARQLAQIAEEYGFDGWLVNIEESFPILSWSVDRMEGFLRQLRRVMGTKRRVVWYDALTTLNFVWYQNTLNSLNLTFALAAGSALTNYAWNPTIAKSAVHMAQKSGLGVGNVYFGVDVWAQNTQTGRNRRVTFPVDGGGGTGTGLGLRSLKELGLNAGVFAPGWSFEHFSANCRAVERSVWLGEDLPLDLACECYPGNPHEIVPYRQNGIIRHSGRFPSGSGTFFHTDFTRALTPTVASTFHAELGSQSILPLSTTAELMPIVGTKSDPNEACGYFRLSNILGREVASLYNAQESLLCKWSAATLPIFDLCMSNRDLNELAISFRHLTEATCILALIIQYSGHDDHRIVLPNVTQDVQTIKTTLPFVSQHITGLLLDVRCQDPGQMRRGRTDILELVSITIQPSGSVKSCELTTLRLEQRGEAEMKHHRLMWEVGGFDKNQAGGSSAHPFSTITGPCAYFEVEVNSVVAGRAYALEFVLSDRVQENCKLDGFIEAKITAVGFDGCTLAKVAKTLPWPTQDEDWIWISHDDVLGGKSFLT